MFCLKQYDIPLLNFEIIEDPIEGQKCRIHKINQEKENLLPLGMKRDDEGLMEWLRESSLKIESLSTGSSPKMGCLTMIRAEFCAYAVDCRLMTAIGSSKTISMEHLRNLIFMRTLL